MTVTVKRALASCFDKHGLDGFAAGLRELGVELIASTGTATFLRQHGVQVSSLEAFAGITEQLEGRVKTLHPRIHAGILARRDVPEHVSAVGAEGLIDLVVVNLYPFQETAQQSGVTLEEVLEQVDVGGVALLRAAAKNFPHVAVASHPEQYPAVLEALRQGRGTMPQTLSRTLAAAAFRLTSAYDQSITAYLGRASAAPPAPLPERLTVEAGRHQVLRYGENAHQHAAWYLPLAGPVSGLAGLRQLQGKPLSYNNLLDLDTALRCLAEFQRPTCVIVKHASPCAIASAETIADAYQRAYAADAESAFGGIVAVNRPLDAAAASQMASVFLEVIAAPAIDAAVQRAFAKKPNLRVIALQDSAASSEPEWRSVLGGWLVQEPDGLTREEATLRVVSKRRPSPQELRDMTFAWIAAKHVTSNAIVLVREEATVGIGQGQPSRVRAVRLAIQNAADRARGAVLASDGFFPFPDNVELAAQAGLTAIMQPGGSVNDDKVIAAADRAGLAMVFTGMRHFRH